jgi:NADPH2:quinone reductase
MGLYYGWGPSDERARYEPQMRAMIEDLLAWTLAGSLKPHVSHVFALDQFREAMHVIRAREAQGKVVVRIGSAP